MYREPSNYRGVQKFAETPDVRRNGIGTNLVSANSVTYCWKWVRNWRK